MAEKILIIKTGAMGDVLRTTCLLRAFPDSDITWVVGKKARELLDGNRFIKRIVEIEDGKNVDGLKEEKFDFVLSLDDGKREAGLAGSIKSKKIAGAYIDKGEVVYNDPSGWFDMGLESRFGKKKADEIKKWNKRSYQEMLFEIAGKKFKGEEYVLDAEPKKIDGKIVGIEARADTRWQMKKWQEYEKLAEKLREKGYEVRFFEQRQTVREFIDDVNNCGAVVTGDTLAMHIALALKKPTVAIFGPTSSKEIYDYGRLKKVVSKLDCVVCYKNECEKQPNCMESISVETVLEEVEKAAAKPTSS